MNLETHIQRQEQYLRVCSPRAAPHVRQEIQMLKGLKVYIATLENEVQSLTNRLTENQKFTYSLMKSEAGITQIFIQYL